MAWSHALWGGGGWRLLLRRHPWSLCNVPGWCFQMGGLAGPEPPLPISVKGLRWDRHVPPTPGWAGLCKQPPPTWEVMREQTSVAADQTLVLFCIQHLATTLASPAHTATHTCLPTKPQHPKVLYLEIVP